jgi:hypothetical protein
VITKQKVQTVPLDCGTVGLEDNAGSIDVMDDEVPLDGVTAEFSDDDGLYDATPLDGVIVRLDDDVGSNVIVNDAARLYGGTVELEDNAGSHG